MKKALLMIGLVLLATVIFAQSSLYDLSYGATLNDTVSKLKAKGFVETARTDQYVTLSGGKDPILPLIKLYFNPDSPNISSWRLDYNLKGNPDLEKTILASLKALHGECTVTDDYDCDYIWYFADDKALYITVYAGDSMTLEYNYGNWDDDDYYYYGDEY